LIARYRFERITPMNKPISIFVIALGWAAAAWAASPAPLTSVRAIHALTNAEAGKGLPVLFQATVTFFREPERTLFVQDGDAAIYVSPPEGASFVPGDRVLIAGTTHADYSSSVTGKSITLLSHGVLPSPVAATYDDLIHGRRDCMVVIVQASIRTVDVQMRSDTRDPRLPMHPVTRVQMLAEGGYIEALVDGGDAGSLSNLLDTEVEVTGIASFGFDGKMQPTGVDLDVTSRDDFKILQRATSNPWSIPETPMDRILTDYRVHDLTQRVRVHGSITYYQPGSALVMQDGSKSLWISTQTRSPLQVGDVADAIGFPFAHNGEMTLTRAEIKDSNTWEPVAPKPATVKQLMASGNLFDLVSIEGQVATSVREAAQDEYVLVNGGQIFTAIYRHPDIVVPPMKEIPVGSRVRVNGICILEDSNPFNAQVPFDILLRSTDDIAVVAMPSVINTRNLTILVALLLVSMFAVGARGWAIERGVRRQTAALAYIERRRRRILEDINGSRPLAEIIEQITELVSFKLKGSPCWCQIAGGAQLGNLPENPRALRIVKRDIPARSGPPLGELFAGFDPLTKPRDIESEALALAAELATLAIETRRLYSDLLRRSEFDLLTDIYNRFSLEQRLDAQIADARENATIFGLIYVDLDQFKQINDIYGHRIGDLYLQQVALRMKNQLRSVDTLARLGGDEFAALLPVARNREDCEEIAQRLERCFDEPFSVSGHILKCKASVGVALYPENGATKDSLLNSADAAMYLAKRIKKQVEPILTG